MLQVIAIFTHHSDSRILLISLDKQAFRLDIAENIVFFGVFLIAHDLFSTVILYYRLGLLNPFDMSLKVLYGSNLSFCDFFAFVAVILNGKRE